MSFGATRISGLILGLLLAVANCCAQAASPSEYQLKAAFLYHFAQFIEWPPTAFTDTAAPMYIGVLGENPFGAELEKTISGKSLNGHPLKTKEIRSLADATNNCHILFISSSEKARLPAIIKALQGSSVLTVGEMDGFTEARGMIGFLPGSKIRFE